MKPVARPWVIANFAITADGKITTRSYMPTGFTSGRDKRRFVEIRSEGDAVLVGRGTMEKDRMAMGLSAEDLRKRRQASGRPAYPLRVVVSESGRLDLDAKMFVAKGGPRVIFSTEKMPGSLRETLAEKADLHLFPDVVDLEEMLGILRRNYSVRTVVCEGGPTLFRNLVQSDCVDELCVTLAPRVFGGQKAPGLTGLGGPAYLVPPVRFALSAMEVRDGEAFLRYKVQRGLVERTR